MILLRILIGKQLPGPIVSVIVWPTADGLMILLNVDTSLDQWVYP